LATQFFWITGTLFMCGICGEYNFGSHRPAEIERVKKMTASLTHRGPDDEGYLCLGPVGLGFRRLSIIDLAGGHQPMVDADRGVFLLFNGEIYNFAELKNELEQYGHRFKTKSDTEVILHGYKQWGIDVLNRLNGMFGLAIWDEQEKRLMLARDRLGVKPLYYRLDSDHVVFGSEIRAILAHGGCKPEVDTAAINLFLRYRYTPSPLTAFKGVKKLAAGTRVVIEKGVPRLERWWNFRPTPFESMPSAAEAEQKLAELYQNAVKRQLMSDVPVGLFLSGGLDSGLLLALMSQSSSDWKAYSVGFGSGFANDELSKAAQTARHFKAQSFSTEITKDEFEKALPNVIRTVEEPVAADSIVPMYFLCQRARQDVKVALMGQGPDELFGGYRRHLFAKYGMYGRMVPDSSRFLVKYALGRLVSKSSAARVLASLEPGDTMQRCRSIFSQLPGESSGLLFQDNLLEADNGSQVLDCWRDLEPIMPDGDELGGLQFLELRSSLPDELLLYADKISMAHGLEVRVPYLDHEIVEFVERLSSSFKVRNGSRKWLHRKVCRRFLPEEFVGRSKLGFETPNGDWLRKGTGAASSEYLQDKESKIYGFLHYGAVQSLLEDHRRGRSGGSDFLFSLIALEVWLRTSWN
jgi:asparagine synthase (glutamine-hydrolysing)